MYSLLLLPLVIANTLLVIWLAGSWYRRRDWLLLITLLPTIMLPYDTAIVALGSTIGQGDLLRALSAAQTKYGGGETSESENLRPAVFTSHNSSSDHDRPLRVESPDV